jgi:hypothetical protein
MAVALLATCCIDFETADCDMNTLYSDTMEARISFWERDQSSRHNYLLNLLSAAGSVKEFRPRAQKSVYVVPTPLGVSLCYACLACFYGCSGRLLYKVSKEVRQGVGRYVNRNKKSMRDDTEDSVAYADCKVWLDGYFTEIGDAMPHSDKIHLPPGEFQDIYNTYVYDMETQGRPVFKKARWRQVWREHFPNVCLGEHSPFATCEVCGKYKRSKLEKHPKAHRAALKAAHSVHKKFVRQERSVYHENRNKDPKEALSMCVDAMDQSKTFLPWIWPFTKAIAALMRMKTHITGVLMNCQKVPCLLFVDYADIPHDPNLTCFVILQSLLALEALGPLPPVLNLQLDNTCRENKNWCLFTFLGVLVLIGVFKEINVKFLPVGHTHEDIDAVFSQIAKKLRRAIVKTVSGLVNILKCAFTKFGRSPDVRIVDEVPNVREWLLPIKPKIDHITQFRSFRLFRRTGSQAVYFNAAENMSDDSSKFTPPEGDLLLDKLPPGEPCRVPLRPTQRSRFEAAVGKYAEINAFNQDDHEEWMSWFRVQSEREQKDCNICRQLTAELRQNGVRSKENDDVKSSKRQAYSKAEKELVQHLTSVGSDGTHRCTNWRLPSPQPSVDLMSSNNEQQGSAPAEGKVVSRPQFRCQAAGLSSSRPRSGRQGKSKVSNPRTKKKKQKKDSTSLSDSDLDR